MEEEVTYISTVQNVPQSTYKFKQYKSQCPVIIETIHGVIVHGIYIKTQGNGSNILIDSTSEFPSKTLTKQVSCYSSREIKYLYIFDEEKDANHYSLACPSLSGISYENFLNARDLIWDSKYIPVYDHNYQNILQEIRSSDVLGIAAIGSHSDKVRFAHASFFVIATRKKIYIFDILFTQKNFWEMGLKSILEDKNTQKIVYDSTTIGDLLYNRYNIKIANVFDVMIADYEIFKKLPQSETKYKVKTLPEIVQMYLNLPKGMFEYTELVLIGVTHRHRPVRDKMKRDVSLAVAFLIYLRDTQRGILLQKFFMASQVYSDYLVSCSKLCRDEKLEEINNSVPREVMVFIENENKVESCYDVDLLSLSEHSSGKSSDK